MKSTFIEAGRIVGTHGIKGELKVECWVDSPDFLKKIKKLYFEEGIGEAEQDMGVLTSRVHKNVLLITINGVTDPAGADALRGKTVFINKNNVKLPKNTFFISDLTGLKVYDGENGKYYGIVEEVFITPANNVYRIVNEEKEYLFPAVDHMIKSTDIEAGRLEVLPIPGIFDDGGYSDAH